MQGKPKTKKPAEPKVKGITSFFDIANVVLKKLEIPSDEDIEKHCNQFMLNMYLSCDMQLAPLAAMMSKLKISNKAYFDMLYFGIPKTTRYITYNAKKVQQDKEIKYLAEYYGCNLEQAKQYRKIISEEEIKSIVEGFENKGVKKG